VPPGLLHFEKYSILNGVTSCIAGEDVTVKLIVMRELSLLV